VSLLDALRRPLPEFEVLTGTVAAPVTTTTCRYVFDAQPGLARGPARYLRPAVELGNGPDSHDHANTQPPAGTPCLIVVIAGSLDSAWVLPFQ
jgi:hypothetical protein